MLVGKCPKPSERKGKERIHERTQKNGANQIQSDGSGTGFNTGKNEARKKEGLSLFNSKNDIDKIIWTFYNEFMFEVRVEADFAAAHFLKDYNGKCENLHGHNYKVFAHVRGYVLNEGGMLLDFSKLKNALRKCCKKIDHTNLNDFEVFEQNPSAERIAVFIYENILQEMKENGIDLSYSEGKKEPFLYAVDVFETETSRARYCSC